MRTASRGVALLALAIAAGQAEAQSTRLLTRADDESRLRGLRLGECIASWTGLRAEASRTAQPFFTDADWAPERWRHGPPGAKKSGALVAPRRSDHPSRIGVAVGRVIYANWLYGMVMPSGTPEVVQPPPR